MSLYRYKVDIWNYGTAAGMLCFCLLGVFVVLSFVYFDFITMWAIHSVEINLYGDTL